MAGAVGIRNRAHAGDAVRGPPVDSRAAPAPRIRAQSGDRRRTARPRSHRCGSGGRFPRASSSRHARLACRRLSHAAAAPPGALAMTPDDYCRDKVARSGSSFYYSFLFLPPERRSAITALYAFCREVDDVVDDVHEPAVAHAKLAWWRQEVSLAYAGKAQHPVARALEPVVVRYALPQAHFQTVIDGMTMDLEQNRYLDFPALEQYCHRVAGVVGLMSAEI